MDEERKARVNATNSKKKMENDIKDLEEHLDGANRAKEDGLRQLKKYQQQAKEVQRDLEDARQARDDIAEQAKDNERKLKQLETDLRQMQEVSASMMCFNGFCLGQCFPSLRDWDSTREDTSNKNCALLWRHHATCLEARSPIRTCSHMDTIDILVATFCLTVSKSRPGVD